MRYKNFERYLPEIKSGSLPDFWDKEKSDEFYEPSDELAAAVNTALALGMPLLLTGEPGTGKSRLAHHLAKYFELGKPIEFVSQTTSTKKDLFYNYRALEHFHYTQINHKEVEPSFVEDKFIDYQALGLAIILASDKKSPKRSIVLIDEIDKAPRDFPNDLLVSLEKLEFDVPEIGGNNDTRSCPKKLSPIIIITSNSEKNLPDAFLRRVVYHHITFPKQPKLLKILQGKKLINFDQAELDELLNHFLHLRENIVLTKKPATAELIAWAALLSKTNFPAMKINTPEKLEKKDRLFLTSSYGVLAKNKEDLDKMISQAEKNG
jgi:MoxR-like ATPase